MPTPTFCNILVTEGKTRVFYESDKRQHVNFIFLQKTWACHGQTDLPVHRHVRLVRPVQAVRPTVCSNVLHASFQTFSLCLLANLSLMLGFDFFNHSTLTQHTVKKGLAIFSSPARMSLTKPGRVGLVTSRLGIGKSLTFILGQGEFG